MYECMYVCMYVCVCEALLQHGINLVGKGINLFSEVSTCTFGSTKAWLAIFLVEVVVVLHLRIDFQYTFPPPSAVIDISLLRAPPQPWKFHCYRQHHHPYTTAKADTTPAAKEAYVTTRHISTSPYKLIQGPSIMTSLRI